jgi:diguanylate cyclase (GGDEF)-like protein
MTVLMRCRSEHQPATPFERATHDPLTGLANRDLFMDRLTQLLSHAARRGNWVGLLCIDLEHVETINECFGEATVEVLLSTIANRLTAITRVEDTIARLGGCRFAALLPDLQEASDGDIVASRLLAALRESQALNDHTVTVSCRVGVAVFPADSSTPTGLMHAAAVAASHASHEYVAAV